MVMTTIEAIRLECPMRRHCLNPNQVYESNFAVYEHSQCEADECPAWRWFEMADSAYSVDRVGYCGMAGPVKYT